MKNLLNLCMPQTKLLLAFAFALLALSACKKDDNNNSSPSSGSTDAQLVIDNGSVSVAANAANFTYTAKLAKTDGSVSSASGVTWSSSDANVITIDANSGVANPVGGGAAYITAKMNYNGAQLLVSVPVSVQLQSLFTVAPWAVIGEPGDHYDFIATYFIVSGDNATYTYTSSDASVASMSGSTITLNKAGTCQITVTAKISGQNVTQTVPVLVVGTPAAPLPVTRVEVTPNTKDLYKGDVLTFSAKAKNSKGDDVSSTVSFTWSTSNDTVATVDASGKVTAKMPGNATIRATANGITGEASIAVYPDTVVIVKPYYASVAAGGTQQFTATVIKTRTNTVLNGLSIKWEVPSFGPGFEMFNIGSIDQNGLLKVNSNATPGLPAFVVATVVGNPYAEGAAGVFVNPVKDSVVCGPGNPSVKTITVTSSSSVTLNMMQGQLTAQITVNATDVSGNTVASPALKFNTSNSSVVQVDDQGNLTAASPGSATITICSGGYAQTTVSVTVQ